VSDPILPFDVWMQQIVQASVPANRNALRAQILASQAISMSVSVQPTAPVDGDVYIVGPSPEGEAWSNFEPEDLAIFRDGSWFAFAPVLGIRLNVNGTERIFLGSSGWVVFGGGSGGGGTWGTIGGNLQDQTDLWNELSDIRTEAESGLLEIVPGDNVTVDTSDPRRPIVSASGGSVGEASWGEIGGNLEDQEDLWQALGDLEQGVNESQQAADDAAQVADDAAQVAGKGAFGVTFDAGSGQLEAGKFGDVVLPYDCTLIAWSIVASGTGSAVVSVWADSLANFPPNSSDNVTGGNPPTLSASDHSSGNTTGWSTNLTAGQVVRFTLQSVSTLSRVTLQLNVTKK
jgi:hypothetical protein